MEAATCDGRRFYWATLLVSDLLFAIGLVVALLDWQPGAFLLIGGR
jgi:hypothetical protein